ncbi:MAG TPA: 23S rRNA (uracil(1939)-C(5))-methyltransferase RlmD [Firmicutes bacterium]|nr:23S rRNA (uracil(1939)-C(5))-methyltransferase RlmD [Bacillota bacterium]
MEQSRPVKNNIYKLTIDSVDRQGIGVARLFGMAVFIPYALAGEKVEAQIIKVAKKYAVGRLLKIIEPSIRRVQPACPYFKRCGGCSFMHMDYSAQLEIKRSETEQTLRRISGLDIKVGNCIGMSNPYHYRNKAQFPVCAVKGEAKIGFYAPRSHNIVNIDRCIIQHECTDRILLAARRAIAQTGISIYNEESHTGELRHIVSRVSYKTGKCVIMPVVNAGHLKGQEEWIRIIREEVPECSGIVLNINRAKGNIILGSEIEAAWGEPYLEENLCGLDFTLSPLSFMQVNSVQAEKLYKLAVQKAGLTGKERVLDAYCGIGIMTMLLAKEALEAIGVEIVESAVKDARKAAQRNNINNVRFAAGDCAQILPEMFNQGAPPDVIVLDPPRAGCEASLLEAIIKSDIPRIVYVSCDPATLARDMAALSGEYTVKSVETVDMFPMTGHVETIVLLQRKTL